MISQLDLGTDDVVFLFFINNYNNPTSTLQQYFSYINAVSFIGGGNKSTRRKPSTHRKALTNFITYYYIGHMGGICPRNFKWLYALVETGSCKSNYHTYDGDHDATLLKD